jgi:hypothetical protein
MIECSAEGSCNIISILQNIFMWMRNAKVPNVCQVPLEGCSIVYWWDYVRMLMTGVWYLFVGGTIITRVSYCAGRIYY